MDITLDDSFSRSFECEVLSELPASIGDHYYFPSGSRAAGKDGLIVKFMPNSGESWIGTFAWGTPTTKGVSTGIFTSPSPEKVCVVSCGNAVIVEVGNPGNFEEVSAFPVMAVVPVPAREILIFSSQTKLYAYGTSGLVWESNRLAWDEIKITCVDGDILKGTVWDLQSEEDVPFQVNLETGHHYGGIAVI